MRPVVLECRLWSVECGMWSVECGVCSMVGQVFGVYVHCVLDGDVDWILDIGDWRKGRVIVLMVEKCLRLGT